MTVTPAVSPFVPFYADLKPYITVAEYLAAPTGVDTSQLIIGGNPAANKSALARRIASASSYADSLCYQVLAATNDLEANEYRIHRDGCIHVALPYSPVISITNVAAGRQAGALLDLPDLSGIAWTGPKVVRIPVCGTQLPWSSQGARALAGHGHVFAEVSYVNGYANTALAADAAAADTSIQVASPLGIFPGLPMTIYDDSPVGASETVTVAAGYVTGSTTVPLTEALANEHTADTAISALPSAIKEAVIALTSHLIKTRGAESLGFTSVSGGSAGATVDKELPGSSEEYELAVDLLHPYRRVV